MLPVIRIDAVVGRQAEDVAFGVDAEAKNRAVGVVEVGGDLVDFEDLAVGEADVPQGCDVGFGEAGGIGVGQDELLQIMANGHGAAVSVLLVEPEVPLAIVIEKMLDAKLRRGPDAAAGGDREAISGQVSSVGPSPHDSESKSTLSSRPLARC